jgi:hypothetical protein
VEHSIRAFLVFISQEVWRQFGLDRLMRAAEKSWIHKTTRKVLSRLIIRIIRLKPELKKEPA